MPSEPHSGDPNDRTRTGQRDASAESAGVGDAEQLRHDLKNELNSLRMGVLVIRQIAASRTHATTEALEKVASRMERCVDEATRLVDERIR